MNRNPPDSPKAETLNVNLPKEDNSQTEKARNNDILPSYLLATKPGKHKQAKYPILTADKRFIPSRRIVHIDLKGAPPKLHFFKGFFEFIAQLGATGTSFNFIKEITFMTGHRGMR